MARSSRSSGQSVWGIVGSTLLAASLLASVAAASDEHQRLESIERSSADYRGALRAQSRGDLAAARAMYGAALEKDPGFVEAMVNLARLDLETGEPDAAEGWLNRAATQRRDYPALHMVRGLLALERSDVALAVRELERARKLAPTDVQILTNLGAALTRQGLDREAIEALSLALQLDPRLQSAALNLAIAYDQQGDRVRAAFHYAHFLDISMNRDPDREVVTRRLAELRGERSNPEPEPREVSRTIAGAVAPAGESPR